MLRTGAASSSRMVTSSVSFMEVKVEAKVERIESPLSRNLDIGLSGSTAMRVYKGTGLI